MGTTATHERASNRKQRMSQSGSGGGDCIYQRPTLTAAGFVEKVTRSAVLGLPETLIRHQLL